MSYTFYLDGVELPITPSKLTTTINNQNKTINLINDGEVNILKLPGLTTISFEFTAPAFRYPFATGEFKSIEYYYSLLETLKTSLKSFQFAVQRKMPSGVMSFATNMTVSLEDYEILEDAENGFDVVFKVDLKQYKPYGTQSIEITNNSDGTKTAATKTARETTKTAAKTYTVKKGDTLWNIAKKELGDGAKYKTLATLNNISNPNKISVGQVLKLG